jgi:hypothetical protein
MIWSLLGAIRKIVGPFYVRPNAPPHTATSFLRLSSLQALKREERLAHLAPECRLIAAQAVENSIF